MAVDSAPQRKDALRKRRAILDAARRLFAEGQDASFAAIAHEAGVGQATVYRHFADRRDLVATLLEEAVERQTGEATALAGDPAGFLRLLEAAASEQAHSQELMSVMRQEEMEEARMERLTERVLDLFREPLRRAQRAGLVRADFPLADVIVVLKMIDGALAHLADPAERERASSRALALVLEGVALER
jgi:AcrR family transcriptional regulator